MKIKLVQVDDLTYGNSINGEVFKVEDGCAELGEAGSLMRALNSKIIEAAAKARGARTRLIPVTD
jgi:hypothetical protein